MNPLLLIVWAALTFSFLALLVYRGQLTRYENEELFLNDSINTYGRQKHVVVVRQMEKIQPFVRAVGGAAGLVTACAVGIYVWQAWKSI